MATHNGYIKSYRSLLDWEWWNDHNTTRLWIWILHSAAFDEFEDDGVTIKAGQLKTTVKEMSEACGLSVQQTRTAISHLKSTNQITIHSTPRYSIYTVKNWGEYQGDNKPNNKASNKPNPQNQQTDENPSLYIKKEDKEEDGQSPKSSSSHPPKSDGSASAHEICSQAIAYLNEQAGKKFLPKAKKTQQLISARLSEGHTIETLKLAVDGAIAKYKDWKPEYIKPDTIFNGEMEKRVEWGRSLKEKNNDRTHYYSGY